MSMSDCIKCWDTPCTCGYEYKDYSLTARIKLAAVILGINKKLLYDKVRQEVPVKHPKFNEK